MTTPQTSTLPGAVGQLALAAASALLAAGEIEKGRERHKDRHANRGEGPDHDYLVRHCRFPLSPCSHANISKLTTCTIFRTSRWKSRPHERSGTPPAIVKLAIEYMKDTP